MPDVGKFRDKVAAASASVTAPSLQPVSKSNGLVSIRLHKGERTKSIGAPSHITIGQLLKKYAGDGDWELHLCLPGSKEGYALFAETRLSELKAAEPIELCIKQDPFR